MDFKDCIKKYLGLYNSCKPKYRMLINILIVVILFNIFNTQIFSRQARSRRVLKRELNSLNNKFQELRRQFPDLDKEEREIFQYRNKIKALSERLKNLEETFPEQARIPTLLSKIIKEGEGKIDFISITPQPLKEKKLYTHLDIEMIIRCPYTDLVNYIYHLETLLEFLVISDISLEKKIDEENEYIESKILLSTLLMAEEKQKPTQILSSQDITEPEFLTDPFISQPEVGQEELASSSFNLSGIIFREDKSSAIINDNVYKVGDKVGDKKITAISKNSVAITDDDKTYVLKLRK